MFYFLNSSQCVSYVQKVLLIQKNKKEIDMQESLLKVISPLENEKKMSVLTASKVALSLIISVLNVHPFLHSLSLSLLLLALHFSSIYCDVYSLRCVFTSLFINCIYSLGH